MTRSDEPTDVDELAKRLCEATKQVLDHARQPVWGLEWDYDDEDALRDTVRAVEEYRRWEATGEHYFLSLRPGLEPQIALADQMLIGLGYLSRSWDDYGIELDEGSAAQVNALMTEYLQLRKTGAGGPGTVNAELWQR